MEIKGITIHNTGNNLSANDLYLLLKKRGSLNLCHYLVDEKDVIQTLPEDVQASHTGRGYDFGNRYTVAIEICRSTCDKQLYLKAEKNAVKLIKKLMKKYKLNNNDLYFHLDFNDTRCPHRALEIHKDKGGFINAYFV